MLKLKQLDQIGAMNPLIIPLVLSGILAIAFAGATAKFYSDFVDQRDNNEPKIEAAVDVALAEQKDELEIEFNEREKQPYKTITGPAEFGSVRLTFPKTWSSYVTRKGSVDYDFYSHPNFVPATGVKYALRMSVTRKAFADEVESYDKQVEKGELKARSVRTSGVTGTRLDGFLEKNLEGSMVLFPLRDKTLRVWTESPDSRKDYDRIILKHLSFVP